MTAQHMLFAHWPPYQPASAIYDMIKAVSPEASGDRVAFYHALTYSYLQDARRPGDTPGVIFGADNMMPADPGSYAEHFSARMIAAARAGFVLLGDAERREVFDETDETIRNKVLHATSHDLLAVLSIKDPSQLSIDLEGLTPEQLAKVMLIYHGPWASFYRDAGLVEEMSEGAKTAREVLKDLLGDVGAALPLLLALPSRIKNAEEIVNHTLEHCNGYYVAKAVVYPNTLLQIANAMSQWQPSVAEQNDEPPAPVDAPKSEEGLEI